MRILDEQLLIKCTGKDKEDARRKAGEAGFDSVAAFLRFFIRHAEVKDIKKLKYKL